MQKFIFSFGLVLAFTLNFVSEVKAQITSQQIISRSSSSQGNATSHCASLSGDARYTLFESYASNLVSGDSNNRTDIFLFDSQTSALRLLSKNANGVLQQGGENPTTCSSNISRDGSTVVYATDGAGLVDAAQTNVSRLYSFDVASGSVELLTPGTLEEGVFFPSVNQDGSRIVFVSNDKNLHPQANGLYQVYMIERPGNTLTMLSVDANGAAGNGQSIRAEISQNGKWAVYETKSTNLKGATLAASSDIYQVFIINLETGEHTLISKNSSNEPGNGDSDGADISADGSQIVFYTTANNLISKDKNKNSDVLLYDRNLGAFELISVSNDGKRIKGFQELLGNSLSADGNLVMFRALIGSFDKFKIEVYVRDRKNSRTYLSSFSNSCSFGAAGGDSHSGSIAPDSPIITFAVGKDTKRSALQLVQVGLDVLQSISSAPNSLDEIDADICSNSAVLAMTPFSLLQTSPVLETSVLAASIKESSGITYETKLVNKNKKSDVKKYTSKRNVLALKNLDSGNYSASYRVKVAGPAGVTRSKFSKATKFKVK